MSAPALGLPDLTKPFELFTYERLNVALGVPAQSLRKQQRAAAHFSKQPDSVAKPGQGAEGRGSHCHLDPGRPKSHPWVAHCSVCTPCRSSCPWAKGGTLAVWQLDAEIPITVIRAGWCYLENNFCCLPAMFLSSTLADGMSKHDCYRQLKKSVPADRASGKSRLEAFYRWEQLHEKW